MRQAFHQYYAALCTYAATLLADSDGAEDIVQETLVRLWQRGKLPDGAPVPASLLYVSVRHACRDRLDSLSTADRRQRAYAAWQHSMSPSCDTALIRAEDLRRCHHLIGNLPTQCRQVMELHFDTGLSLAEIAARMHLSHSTVKTQKQRGIAYLRKMMKEK